MQKGVTTYFGPLKILQAKTITQVHLPKCKKPKTEESYQKNLKNGVVTYRYFVELWGLKIELTF